MIKYILLWNAVVFIVFGLDKLFAKINSRRISEKTLILIAFMCGGAGALMGMHIFRHKTRKTKFKILIPIAFFICVVIIFAIMLKCFHYNLEALY